jgi:hypothetical protein
MNPIGSSQVLKGWKITSKVLLDSPPFRSATPVAKKTKGKAKKQERPGPVPTRKALQDQFAGVRQHANVLYCAETRGEKLPISVAKKFILGVHHLAHALRRARLDGDLWETIIKMDKSCVAADMCFSEGKFDEGLAELATARAEFRGNWDKLAARIAELGTTEKAMKPTQPAPKKPIPRKSKFRHRQQVQTGPATARP